MKILPEESVCSKWQLFGSSFMGVSPFSIDWRVC